MFDILKEKTCPHQIFDEELTLQGSSPTYFAPLKYTCNLNTNAVEVREFASTNSLTNYTYTINGFTNWSISSDGRQINFNTLGLSAGAASFADGSTMIDPQRVYMMTYLATQDTCPLHQTPRVGYSPIQLDININEQGRFDVVTGREKVRQMVLKALLTVVGSNVFYPAYGSLTSNMIGQRFDLFTQFNLQSSVQDAIDFLIQQQQLQPIIPQAELILRVSSVDVQQDEQDPRVIRVAIKVLTGLYEEVPVAFGVVT